VRALSPPPFSAATSPPPRALQVLMFVNISPVLWNAPETTCSLNFATRCRSVELGTAKKNTESAELTRLRRLVASLQSGGGAAAAAPSGGAGGAAAAPRPRGK
jgi:hypothetical protein